MQNGQQKMGKYVPGSNDQLAATFLSLQTTKPPPGSRYRGQRISIAPRVIDVMIMPSCDLTAKTRDTESSTDAPTVALKGISQYYVVVAANSGSEKNEEEKRTTGIGDLIDLVAFCR